MKNLPGRPLAPSKIVCVGRNYADHAKELGNTLPSAPLLFLKAPSATTYHGHPIVLPDQSDQVEHEAELAVVISKTCKRLSGADWVADFIAGYACLNDVTARDIQRSDMQFTRAKSFDTFCPIGPLVQADCDTSDVRIKCRVNGDVRQDSRTSQMGLFSRLFDTIHFEPDDPHARRYNRHRNARGRLKTQSRRHL